MTAECAARKKAKTFKAAGLEDEEVGTKESSDESGKDFVNPCRMALWLLQKVLFDLLQYMLESRSDQLARWRYWKDQWKGNIEL